VTKRSRAPAHVSCALSQFPKNGDTRISPLGSSRTLARPLTLFIIALILSSYVALATTDLLDVSEQVLDRIERTYGTEARERVIRWRELVEHLKDQPELTQVHAVNLFFNELNFVADTSHWGQEDYWATPLEFLGSNAGDCEDFSVAKYFTLKELGVPDVRMNLTYVKSLSLNQAHMVLTYFPEPGAEPLVLDNIIKQIQPASNRLDLLPIYGFNGESLWLAKQRGRGQLVGTADRLGAWRGLNGRMQKQTLRAVN